MIIKYMTRLNVKTNFPNKYHISYVEERQENRYQLILLHLEVSKEANNAKNQKIGTTFSLNILIND